MKKFIKISGLEKYNIKDIKTQKVDFKIIQEFGLVLPKLIIKIKNANLLQTNIINETKVDLVFEDETYNFILFQENIRDTDLELLFVLDVIDFIQTMKQSCFDGDFLTAIKQIKSINFDIANINGKTKQKWYQMGVTDKDYLFDLLKHSDSDLQLMYHIGLEKKVFIKKLDDLKKQKQKEIKTYYGFSQSTLPFSMINNVNQSGVSIMQGDKDVYDTNAIGNQVSSLLIDCGNTSENFYKNFFDNKNNFKNIFAKYANVVVSADVEMFDLIYLKDLDKKIIITYLEKNLTEGNFGINANVGGIVL